jgi:hypothetical protein
VVSSAKGNRHDLGGQDEIGANGAPDLLLLDHRMIDGTGLGGVQGVIAAMVARKSMRDFLGAFEAEIGAADHQDRSDRPGQEGGEEKRRGQQEEQLVLEAAAGDAPDDRQLALRFEPGDIAGGDGRIVDDDARCLAARLAGGGTDIVEAGGRQFGEAGDVVEQGYKSGWHG